jgi:hypothetical protein
MLGSRVKSKETGTVYTVTAQANDGHDFVLRPDEFGTNIAVPVVELDRDFKVLSVAESPKIVSDAEGWATLAERHMTDLTRDPEQRVTPPTPEQQIAVAQGEVSAEEIASSPTFRWAFLGGSLACDSRTATKVRKLIEAEGE